MLSSDQNEAERHRCRPALQGHENVKRFNLYGLASLAQQYVGGGQVLFNNHCAKYTTRK